MGKCSKRRWRDKIGAELFIATVQRKDNVKRPKTECRAYYCGICKGWHTTSQPIRERLNANV